MKEQHNTEEYYYIDIFEDPDNFDVDFIKNDEIIKEDDIIDFPNDIDPEIKESKNNTYLMAKDSDINLSKQSIDKTNKDLIKDFNEDPKITMKNEINSDLENLEIKIENKNKNNNKSLEETYLEKNEDRENFLSGIFKKHKKKEAITYNDKIKLAQLIIDKVYSLHSLSEKIGFDRRDIRL